MNVTIKSINSVETKDYDFFLKCINVIQKYVIDFKAEIGIFKLEGKYEETAKIIDEIPIGELENQIKEYLLSELEGAKNESNT